MHAGVSRQSSHPTARASPSPQLPCWWHGDSPRDPLTKDRVAGRASLVSEPCGLPSQPGMPHAHRLPSEPCSWPAPHPQGQLPGAPQDTQPWHNGRNGVKIRDFRPSRRGCQQGRQNYTSQSAPGPACCRGKAEGPSHQLLPAPKLFSLLFICGFSALNRLPRPLNWGIIATTCPSTRVQLITGAYLLAARQQKRTLQLPLLLRRQPEEMEESEQGPGWGQ